jgi:aldehyde dehydrogenase (NAD+)
MLDRTLERLGIREMNSGVFAGEWLEAGGKELASQNPATGEVIARVKTASKENYDEVVSRAQESFNTWRTMPAPKRGEIVRQIGNALRERQKDLGLLVTYEVGKIKSEGVGEVQEMIDMCDFAVGLSRQLYGLSIASERPNHRMLEQWHPLGPVGIITAFNFPVAVWAWNAAVAAVCGDTCVWKPAPEAPLTAIAVQRIINIVTSHHNVEGVFNLAIGEGSDVGEWIADDPRFPLVSATGSCAMGRSVGATVAARLGRSLLELGGNNGAIITENADLDLALRAVVFAAVGTAGQRCTTLRRLFLHESIADDFVARLRSAYGSIRIGDPWDDSTLMGPLIEDRAVNTMMAAINNVPKQGGEVIFGGKPIKRRGYFVEPTLVRATPDMPLIQEETFAPILYIIPYRDLDEAIAWHNGVSQGLSSAIFANDVRQAERFLSPAGSDCGIANVNIGTSGAEIGGAFGGEKDTGGGREAGSDSWKAYMRRQTCTINYGGELPLAQGVKFDVT